MQLKLGAPVGEILVAEGWVTRTQINAALAEQNALREINLALQPPDPALCALQSHNFWLRHKAVPWLKIGQTVMVATTRPDRFAQLCEELGDGFADAVPVLAPEEQIEQAIANQFRVPLARAAGTRVDEAFSCRTWQYKKRPALPIILGVTALMLWSWPGVALAVLSLLAIATLAMFVGLRAVGLFGFLLPERPPEIRPNPEPDRPERLPKVSVLVPLFRETEIAAALIKRLSQLEYPKALLDVILVLEARDELTRKTVAQTDLPNWMRVIEVPAYGGLTTKPRAMNYALDFCKGDIVGVWDAEDAPMPDQIEKVVARFAKAPDDVVCLQGVLDYYNPATNWLARCFTIEYSSWFRVVLQGIARLGLVVPLGGTTLFFRRSVLEELGGWDAHNVTEDADLGVRLCRAGYRTEMIDTVTYEEANCRPWPWIKQRSRWLKGFMVTYLVHMRRPGELLRDLGMARFLGVQAFFLGTLGQFLLAPVLWSYWLMLLGMGHPLEGILSHGAMVGLTVLFVGAEILSITVGLIAVSRPERRYLMKWVPTLFFYFPLAAVAAYKALYELIFHPFYWDKTQHGVVKTDHGT